MEKRFIMMKLAEAVKTYLCNKKNKWSTEKHSPVSKKYCEVNENHAENSIKNVQKPF